MSEKLEDMVRNFLHNHTFIQKSNTDPDNLWHDGKVDAFISDMTINAEETQYFYRLNNGQDKKDFLESIMQFKNEPEKIVNIYNLFGNYQNHLQSLLTGHQIYFGYQEKEVEIEALYAILSTPTIYFNIEDVEKTCDYIKMMTRSQGLRESEKVQIGLANHFNNCNFLLEDAQYINIYEKIFSCGLEGFLQKLNNQEDLFQENTKSFISLKLNKKALFSQNQSLRFEALKSIFENISHINEVNFPAMHALSQDNKEITLIIENKDQGSVLKAKRFLNIIMKNYHPLENNPDILKPAVLQSVLEVDLNIQNKPPNTFKI